MKLLTKEEDEAHNAATIRGGVEGLVGAAALTLPVLLYANKRVGWYQALPKNWKLFSLIITTVPACVIRAETEGIKYEQSLWSGAGKMELDEEAARQITRWDTLSGTEKVGDWAKRHQFGIIGGSWAGSMAGSIAYVMRNPYLTTTQRIVTARMYAQALTIGVLGVAGLLRFYNSDPDAKPEPDHSWARILEAEEREKRMAQKELDAAREKFQSSKPTA